MNCMDIHLSRRWDDELYHFGIKGQKYGVRRFQNLDRTWTEAGKIRYGRKGNKIDRFIQSHIDTHKYDMERSKTSIDKSTGFHVKIDKLTPEEDLKRVNPRFDSSITQRYKMNCMYCTATYEMRRRGYDVTASANDRGTAGQAVINWFPGGKIQRIVRGTDTSGWDWPKEVVNKMVKQYPNGSRGNCSVKWGNTNCGHSLMFEIKDGKVILWDGQSGAKHTDPSEIFRNAGKVHLYRFDNLDFDSNAIKECCK